MFKTKDIFAIFLVPLLFFFFATATLSDYGINWDEPTHFNRGQGYLNFFLTGNKNENLPVTNKPSYFHNHAFSYKALLTWDGGHPPASDILASLTNLIFYQKLGILGDVQAYHLYNVFVSTLVVFVVVLFAYRTYGLFASTVAAVTIATYPLFFSEAHFNIKDPAETAFISLTIFAFWMSLERENWKWLILAGVSSGLGLGTKFNILFLPFILGPYIFLRYFPIIKRGPIKIVSSIKNIKRKYLVALAGVPIIALAIFFITWPFLWEDTIPHFLKVLHYYKDIGSGFDYQPKEYRVLGFNFYPVAWVVLTTPPWVLLLTVFGFVCAFFKASNKKTTWLWLLWFLIPFARVSFPNVTVYGGVRQILEFLPAMALLSGLGAWSLRNLIIKLLHMKTDGMKVLVSVIILALFIPHFFVMTKLHPNENVYFNSLIGGLSGAKAHNIPSWGNSYGNAYWQAIQWLNLNAEQKAKFALVQGTGQNIAGLYVRPDIIFSNTSWSGINRKGEYLMELTYEGSARQYPYVWDYLEAFMIPAYEVDVDGVAIAKVWKNDLEHTRPEMRMQEALDNQQIHSSWNDNVLTIDMDNPVMLSRLILPYAGYPNCTKNGTVEVSLNKESWGMEHESLLTEQVRHEYDIGENTVNFYFPARMGRFIRVTTPKENSCFNKNPNASVYVLR